MCVCVRVCACVYSLYIERDFLFTVYLYIMYVL